MRHFRQISIQIARLNAIDLVGFLDFIDNVVAIDMRLCIACQISMLKFARYSYIKGI